VLAGLVYELIEGPSVLALDALLQLRGDVHRHLRVGVADLAHDQSTSKRLASSARASCAAAGAAPGSSPAPTRALRGVALDLDHAGAAAPIRMSSFTTGLARGSDRVRGGPQSYVALGPPADGVYG
jgi:hypothetical protein